jgi:hypothetical protein
MLLLKHLEDRHTESNQNKTIFFPAVRTKLSAVDKVFVDTINALLKSGKTKISTQSPQAGL